jgi:hypothetical protein
MYISSAMDVAARSTAVYMAGKASAPFLRRRTVVIERIDSLETEIENFKVQNGKQEVHEISSPLSQL